MRRPGNRWLLPALAALAGGLVSASSADAACCYFSAQNADILQPAQKVFITWDPVKQVESFTVQPKFEGNALDFGMVIPTPSQPKLHEMPRDFFKHLAVFSILKKREVPQSRLLYLEDTKRMTTYAFQSFARDDSFKVTAESKPAVVVLEQGVV